MDATIDLEAIERDIWEAERLMAEARRLKRPEIENEARRLADQLRDKKKKQLNRMFR
jgi:hypothetical protein